MHQAVGHFPFGFARSSKRRDTLGLQSHGSDGTRAAASYVGQWSRARLTVAGTARSALSKAGAHDSDDISSSYGRDR